MKKNWIYLLALSLAVLAIAGFFTYKAINKSDSTDTKTDQNFNNAISLDFNQPLCDQISASVVQTALGVNIVKTEPITNSTSNICQYYVDDSHFVTLRLNKLNYENQKKGQTVLDRQVTTNPNIEGEHFVAIQEDGLINDIVIKIDDNMFLAVDKNSSKAANEEQIVALASAIVKYLKSNTNSDSTSNNQDTVVSKNTDEQFIKQFFGLIESKKASEAVMLMTSKNTGDDSTKQAWGVQFNNISSVKVISILAVSESEWTQNKHQYKVVLDVVMNPNSADAPIPYYGYENGQNIRFISLVKEDGSWKVDEIATGP